MPFAVPTSGYVGMCASTYLMWMKEVERAADKIIGERRIEYKQSHESITVIAQGQMRFVHVPGAHERLQIDRCGHRGQWQLASRLIVITQTVKIIN